MIDRCSETVLKLNTGRLGSSAVISPRTAASRALDAVGECADGERRGRDIPRPCRRSIDLEFLPFSRASGPALDFNRERRDLEAQR